MSRVLLVSWTERRGRYVFVSVPNEHGRYVRTDASVVNVPCPTCGSIVGEPCRGGAGRYWGGTHGDRRTLFRQRFGNYGGGNRDDFTSSADGAGLVVRREKSQDTINRVQRAIQMAAWPVPEKERDGEPFYSRLAKAAVDAMRMVL